MTQSARPISDISVGGSWSFFPSGTTAWNLLNETPANDSTLLSANLIFSSDSFRVKLGSIPDPLVATGHTISARVQDFSSVPFVWTISLYEGGVLRASYNAGDGGSPWTDYTYTLTAAEANAISNYGDLRIDVFASDGIGGFAPYECSQVFFQTPDAPAAGVVLMPQACL